MAADSGGAARRRVVIIGGGFGGLAAARELRHADVDVTLIDRMNHHLFQPLLYQAAAGAVAPSETAPAIRPFLRSSRNTRVLMADVTDVDPQAREVVLDRGERIGYDSLIVACGGETSYFGNDEWSEVTCGLKTLNDAIDLRNRIYGALEQGERAEDPALRDEWLTFVVVGGGPTGVEVAGALGVIAQESRRGDYVRFAPDQVRVVLLDAGERVLSAFDPSLSAKATGALADLGVTVHEGARVTAIDARGVTYEADGNTGRIPSRTVVWAAGVHAVPLVQALARATRAETDRGGRVKVQPDLSLAGHPEVSVVGDVATLAGSDGKPLPGLATVAIQQARHVAKGIAQGRPGAGTPFRYFDKGALAVVGRSMAVCEIRGLKLSGLPALATYFGVHLYYLGGTPGHRVKVLIDWASTRMGDRGGQLVDGRLDSIERVPPDVEAVR